MLIPDIAVLLLVQYRAEVLWVVRPVELTLGVQPPSAWLEVHLLHIAVAFSAIGPILGVLVVLGINLPLLGIGIPAEGDRPRGDSRSALGRFLVYADIADLLFLGCHDVAVNSSQAFSFISAPEPNQALLRRRSIFTSSSP